MFGRVVERTLTQPGVRTPTVTERGDDMHKRALAMTLAALCAAGTITIGTIVPATGDEGVSVRFTVTQGITTEGEFMGAFSPDFSRCTTGFPCVVPVKPIFEPTPGAYNGTLTGDIQGTASFKGSAILGAANDLNPATFDFPYDSYNPFSGTVEGCGTGTFILHNEGNLNSNTGQWWIVPGSGRLGLTGISGNGTFSSPAPFTPAAYIGHIRCGKDE
jgi:hypothetical protein